MNQTTSTISKALVLLIITLGPTLLGSYYDEWRWPLIFSSTLLILTSPLLHLLTAPSFSKINKINPSSLYLTLATLTICAIGIFMWHNTWGEFNHEVSHIGKFHSWKITPLANQPHISLPGAPDKTEALDRLSYIVPSLFLILSIKLLIKSKLLTIKCICTFLFWTGVGIAILGLAQKFTNAEGFFWNKDLFDRYRLLFFSTFRSPGIASCYLNICLAIGLSKLLTTAHEASKHENPKPTSTILTSIGIITLFSAIVSASSKAGILFAILTLTLWIIFNVKSIIHFFYQASHLLPSGSTHERNIIISTATIAFILGALSFGNTVSKRWEKSFQSDHNTLQLRQTANEVQIKMIQDPQWSKVAGFGPGSFFPMFHYYKMDTDLKNTWVYAHNDHLQTLVEWGWLGTGCFAFIIGGGCLMSLKAGLSKKRNYRTADKLYLRGITLAIFICLLHATVDFPFQIESIAITIAILLGACWSTPHLRISKK